MDKMNHAVIVGAGMAGLASAAALSPYFKKVTVLDKDQRDRNDDVFPAGVRKAVPQGAHIHILLRAGLDRLESILPGISSALESRGAVRVSFGSDQQIYEYGGWMPNRDLGIHFLSQSRPLLENVVFDYVSKIDNVQISHRSPVERLNFATDPKGGAPSVTLRDGSKIASDIVIDAAGNGAPFLSEVSKVLSGEVPVEKSSIDLFYATLHFKKKAEWQGCQENILVNPEPGVSHIGGSLISIEGESWCVSLHGTNGIKPPKTIEEWMDMAKNLADQRIWQRICGADTLGSLKVFKKAHSVFRRFDQVSGIPIGYFPVGDTITSFNPIYGQGMTVALGHVLALRDAFAKKSSDLGFVFKDYLENAIDSSRPAWERAASFDKNNKLISAQEGRMETLRKLTRARHSKAESDSGFHLQLAKQVHMLL
ncbi:NAD(P)-binding protein [Microbulbifer aggregans]|uniref:NAD(P)-binding protein n=1 Tax=Microbulbifer aggregans TaxID=1769779 RepID=UPI001CFE505F|nr:NAD(P)-binding protein [Microbulbifer aggregans]